MTSHMQGGGGNSSRMFSHAYENHLANGGGEVLASKSSSSANKAGLANSSSLDYLYQAISLIEQKNNSNANNALGGTFNSNLGSKMYAVTTPPASLLQHQQQQQLHNQHNVTNPSGIIDPNTRYIRSMLKSCKNNTHFELKSRT